MMNFFKEVWNALSGIVEFAIHGIQSLTNLLIKIPDYISVLINVVAQIPQIYQGVIIAAISISVIFLITNRGK